MQLDQRFWEIYGFCGNPYDTGALSTSGLSLLPISKAFVGRSLDSVAFKQINSILRNPGGGRLMVEGEIGVGKTTFVNYHRYIWENHAKDKLFSPVCEIPICSGWGVKDILINILGGITNKFLLIFGEQKTKKDPIFGQLLALNRLLHEKSTEWSFNAPLGGASSKINTPEISYTHLRDYYEKAVLQICSVGYSGLIIHFDNLEFVGRTEKEKTQHLFEEIRDILQMPNVYYLFIGHPGFFSEIISPLERVRSIFCSWPVYLPPLSKQEVLDAMHRRYELLSKGKKYIPPTDDASICYLYDLYEGKIRFIMDTLGDIVRNLMSNAQTLTISVIRQHLQKLAEERISWALTDVQKKVLLAAARLGNFTSPEICKKLNMHKQNAALYINALLKHNFIYPIERQGKTVVYKVREDVRIIAGLHKVHEFVNVADKETQYSSLSTRKKIIMELFRDKKKANSPEIAKATNTKIHTIRRELNELVIAGYLLSHGHTRDKYYSLKE